MSFRCRRVISLPKGPCRSPTSRLQPKEGLRLAAASGVARRNYGPARPRRERAVPFWDSMEKVDQSAGSDQKRAKYRMGLVVAGLLLFARALMGALLLSARRFEQGAKELQTPSKKGSEAMVEGSGDVPEEASDARLQWSEWAAYAACAWALTFAAVHLYRALGGTVGLPPGFTVAMKPALFVIDVLAVPLCVVGALLTLSLVRPWGRLLPRRLLRRDLTGSRGELPDIRHSPTQESLSLPVWPALLP